MKKVFILMTIVIALFAMVSCETDPFANPVDATPEETERILDIYMTVLGVFNQEDILNYDIEISEDGESVSFKMKDGVEITNPANGAVVSELFVFESKGVSRVNAKVKLDDDVHTIMVYGSESTGMIVNLDGKAYHIEKT